MRIAITRLKKHTGTPEQQKGRGPVKGLGAMATYKK